MEVDQFRRLVHKVGSSKQLVLEEFQEASQRGIPVSDEAVETRCQCESKLNSQHGIVPCFETLMNIPLLIRKQHFIESLLEHQVILGTVVDYAGAGVRIRIEATDSGPARDLTDLKVDCVCPTREWPLCCGREKLDQFKRNDYIRAVVIRVPPRVRSPNESISFQQLEVTMRVENLPPRFAKLRLGLLDKQELPAYAKSILFYHGLPSNYVFDFNKFLESQSGFRNPAASEHLLERACADPSGFKQVVSLLDDINQCVLPAGETAESLRKKQNSNYALRFVETGVGHYRGGRFAEAMSCYLRALDADPDCVDAFVARGALYTVTESFEIAVENFDEALRRDSSNANARSYLTKTLVLFGNKKLQEVNEKSVKEAKELYERALKVDNQSADAISALERVAQLEVQLLADSVRKRRGAKGHRSKTSKTRKSELNEGGQSSEDEVRDETVIDCNTVPVVRSAICVLEKLVDQDSAATKAEVKAEDSASKRRASRSRSRSRQRSVRHSASKSRWRSRSREIGTNDDAHHHHGVDSDDFADPRKSRRESEERHKLQIQADAREKVAEYQQFMRVLKERRAAQKPGIEDNPQSKEAVVDRKTHDTSDRLSGHADSHHSDGHTPSSSQKLGSYVFVPNRKR